MAAPPGQFIPLQAVNALKETILGQEPNSTLKRFGIAVKYLTVSHFNTAQVIFLFLHVHATQVVKWFPLLKKGNYSSLFGRN